MFLHEHPHNGDPQFVNEPSRGTGPGGGCLRTTCRLLGRAAVLLAVLSRGAASGSDDLSLYDRMMQHVAFLPEYNLQTDISTFAFHKNSTFRGNYLAESENRLEFSMVSVEDFLYSVWDVDYKLNIGERPGNIVFTVLSIGFKLTPTVEVRTTNVNLHAGLEHFCLHEVDRKDHSIVHWNSLFVGCGSKNMRINTYWRPLAREGGWSLKNRFSWYGRAGMFLREFFGIVGPGKLNGNNLKTFEAQGRFRFAFYRRRSWIVCAVLGPTLGAYRSSGGPRMFGRAAQGVRMMFRRGRRGASFDAFFYLDRLPPNQGVSRFSKDRLMEFTVTFFN